MMSRSTLAERIVDVDDEIKEIEREMQSLRSRKQKLLEEKQSIHRQLNAKSRDTTNNNIWESDSFKWSEDCRRILRDVFKLQSFRPLQRSVINSILSKEDTLIIMSTGGGKSLCYQLPAVLLQGISLVVSPLISLIEDQILQLKKLNVEAATLNQSTSREEVLSIQKSLTDQGSSLRLLYVTPEKLAKSKRLMNQLEKCAQLKILKLIAIDEVHCCSQWGYDFRPDYKFLNILKRQFKGVPLLGLTATASTTVIEDIKDILNIPAAIVFWSDFNRPNLFYEVRQKPSATEHLDEMCSLINGKFSGQSGIIYCFTRKECEELADALRQKGIRSAYYHAYLESDKRSRCHERWIQGKIQVIVATVAFGMGIDKPDVRFVIHHSMAKSIENYYQESGRAGRDGLEATCILYFRLSDLFRQSTMVCTEKNGLTYLYGMLNYCLQKNVCRRTLFADLYNSEWESALCNEKCDICTTKSQCKMVDVTYLWKKIFNILDESEKTNETNNRLTGAKVVELSLKKDKQTSRELAETACGNFLLLHYFEEQFHFTPYTIISYLKPTAKSRQFISDPSHKIEIQFPSTNDKRNANKRKRQRENSEVIVL